MLIKNYNEYKTKLKETFDNYEEPINNEDVHSFIVMYHLDSDWQIVADDVIKDINSQVLKKRKGISSYREYLIKIKKEFDIPKEMPETSQIEGFIRKYNLKKDWGITINDVSKDLEEIVGGKYDEMMKDALPKTFKRASSNGNRIIRKYNKPMFSIPIPKEFRDSLIKGGVCDTPKKPEKSQPKCKKPNIFIDGDNHIRDSLIKGGVCNTPKKPEKSQPKCKKLNILVDGDNHINEAIVGIEKVEKGKNIRVCVYFNNLNTKEKYEEKYGEYAEFIYVKFNEPGDQAVDNRIKTYAGQMLSRGEAVEIVSHDKGYDPFIEKHGKDKVFRSHSVNEAIDKYGRK